MRQSANDVLGNNLDHTNWIPLLDLAVREVFELMLGCVLVTPETGQEVDDIGLNTTSMVGLAGDLCGVLSLRCDEQSAALVASKMLGVDLDKVGPEISDALGEVCNMVAGNFKNKITGLSEGCMLSVPTVITGTDYNLQSQANYPALGVRLLFEGRPVITSLQIRG